MKTENHIKSEHARLHLLKIILALKTLLLSTVIFAHLPPSNTESSQFVLKGKARNHPQDFWEINVSTFWGYQSVGIPMEENGTFYKVIPISFPQDVLLALNKSIRIFAVPGDTLEITWDGNDFNNSFKIVSSEKWRQQELDLMLELHEKYTSSYFDFSTKLFDRNSSDSSKISMIKKRFSDQVQTVLGYPATRHTKKILGDIYFDHLELMLQQGWIPDHQLSFSDALPATVAEGLNLSRLNIKNIDHSLFCQSISYRNFIFNHVRLSRLFNTVTMASTVEESRLTETTETKTSFTRNACYNGMASLYLSSFVLDWYLAHSIISGFEHYSFEDAEVAFMEFEPRISVSIFKDTLRKFYEGMQRLRKGRAAPDFVLKDVNGRNVALNNFKGKVVYLDIWSPYCGPCRHEMLNAAPLLHERYALRNVIFLSICVDATEEKWKENLKKLNPKGINLYADRRKNQKLMSDYNVNSVPRYILIDQTGKIVNNNAGRPSDLHDTENNEIDELLRANKTSANK